MSEMKTLKFPGDIEPREIVDAKARENISLLSDKIAASSSALVLEGTVLANNEIVFDPLTNGQNPYDAAFAAYIAGRLVQIDVTNAAGEWNTILILSRVSTGVLQFFNYEETEYDEEKRIQLVKMFSDNSATYSYIKVPTKTSQLTNDSGFLTSHQDISGKQDKTTLEADVAAKGFTKNTGTYSKPTGGIPKADLAEAVQTSLGKADTALQEHQSLAAYRTAAAQDTIDSGKVDKVTGKGLSSNDYTDAAKSKVDALAPVATSGSYNDLTDKPTIPAALPNPNAITFTGAVTGSYNGSAPMSVNIPSAVTDAHINSLIDTKLGVIENGSY